MATTYPLAPRSDFLQWCQTHGPIFTANAAAIGLTPAQATAFNTAYTAVSAAVAAQDTARAVAVTATAAMNTALATMRAAAGDTVRLIRAFAEVQTKPSTVYQLAQIPAPATPSPAPPPGTPANFVVELLQSGWLKLSWKCPNPPGTSGTTYEIRRRMDNAGPFVSVGVSGQRSFVDTTLPGGLDSVTYQITAIRSTARGNSAEWNVNFSVPGGGGFSVTQTAGAEASVRGASLTQPGAFQPGRAHRGRSSSDGHDGGLSQSTVNGKAVHKTLPNGNGARGKSRV